MTDLVLSSPPRPASSPDEARTPRIDLVPSSRPLGRGTRDEGLESAEPEPTSSPSSRRLIRLEDLPRLALDHRRLTEQVEALLGAGERVPCVGDPRWTSEDRQEQQTAAEECIGCPALDACGAYFRRWPEPAGVWAGLTERDRDGRVKRGTA